jgi:hypothetical protein
MFKVAAVSTRAAADIEDSSSGPNVIVFIQRSQLFLNEWSLPQTIGGYIVHDAIKVIHFATVP